MSGKPSLMWRSACSPGRTSAQPNLVQRIDIDDILNIEGRGAGEWAPPRSPIEIIENYHAHGEAIEDATGEARDAIERAAHEAGIAAESRVAEEGSSAPAVKVAEVRNTASPRDRSLVNTEYSGPQDFELYYLVFDANENLLDRPTA